LTMPNQHYSPPAPRRPFITRPSIRLVHDDMLVLREILLDLADTGDLIPREQLLLSKVEAIIQKMESGYKRRNGG
jgi:hypothetical protein